MNPSSSLYYGPTNRPQRRDPAMSYRCHLGTNGVNNVSEHHRQCHGTSWGPNLYGPGVPCICSCHSTELKPRP